MEFVIVSFPAKRTVLVDDQESGFTNDILRLDHGPHTFALAGPNDHKPDLLTVNVTGTNIVAPMEVTFEKI